MKNSYYLYNNEAIAFFAIACILQKLGQLDFGKLLLILPLILHDQTVDKLLTKEYNSLNDFLSENNTIEETFNNRYLDLTPITINSIKLLNDAGLIEIKKSYVTFIGTDYNAISFAETSLRSRKILKVSNHIVNILNQHSAESLYHIFRIKL